MDVVELEIDLLAEAIKKRYGYDLKNYTQQVVRRVLSDASHDWHCAHISEMIPRLLYDAELFHRLIAKMSNTVTEMFRNPAFYQAVRQDVVAHLQVHPFLKVWHCGCATGEEVYSMAILFKEEGLLSRTQFYATDFNLKALNFGKRGVYSQERLRQYTHNYNSSGGKRSFSDYYEATERGGVMDASLMSHITFAHHDLMYDGSLGEMHMILCRNVLIYFEKKAVNRILRMFCSTLSPSGVLCLGRDESLAFSDVEKEFSALNKEQKIYLKKG